MAHVRRCTQLVVLCLVVAFLAISAEAAQIRRAAEPVKDRYIVTLSPMTANVDAVAKKLAETYDGRLIAIWKHAVKGFWIELTPANAARLTRDNRVDAIEEDALIDVSSEGSQPTGPGSAVPPVFEGDTDPLWHLTRISHRGNTPGFGETGNYHVYRWGNDGSYNDGTGVKGVKVYLIDTGVWAGHDEFQGATVNKGYNAAGVPDYALSGVPNHPNRPDNSPATNPCHHEAFLVDPLLWHGTDSEPVWHGTQTGPLVVGRNVGVAKKAELVPVTMIACPPVDAPRSSTAILIGALDWVRQNAKPPAVVSMSTYRRVEDTVINGTTFEKCVPGSGGRPCVVENDLTVLENAINAVVDAGIPVIASANNQNTDACITTPARLSRRGGRTNAGARTSVITVGGSDRSDRRWDTPDLERGSNFGQCVDIWAPARHISVAIPGVTDDVQPRYGHQYDKKKIHTGTSFAAPIVAGVVARMLATETTLWNGVTDKRAIVDAVYDRLKTNASILTATNLGTGSPRELVYLGGVMFKKQPESAIVAQGAMHDLTVGVVESDVTVKWYRKKLITNQTTSDEEVGTGSPLTITANTTQLGSDGKAEFWARVTRNTPATPSYYADTRRVTVTIGTCGTLPKIAADPVSHWLTPQQQTATPELRATVEASVGFNYRWERLDPQPGTIKEGAVSASQLEDGKEDVTAIDPLTFNGLATYQLVVTPAVACTPATTEVRSDTAQIRRLCTTPAKPTLVKSGVHVTLTEFPESNVKPLWYFQSPPTPDSPFSKDKYVPLRVEVPPADAHANGGADWMVYEDTSIVPPMPGLYAVRAGNACAVSDYSDFVTVNNNETCPFGLFGRDGTQWLLPGTIVGREIHVPEGARVRLDVRPNWFASNGVTASTPVPLSYDWDVLGSDAVGDESHDGRSYLTPPVGPGRTEVEVKANPAWGGCEVTLKFVIIADSNLSCSEPLFGKGGICGERMREEIIRAPRNRIVPLRISVTEDEAAVANISTVHFEWRDSISQQAIRDANGEVVRGNGVWSMLYRIPESPQRIDVNLTKGECKDVVSIYIEPTDAVCDEVNCVFTCPPKRRSIRANGVETTRYTFTYGEVVTFSVSDPVPGYTYEWHRIPQGGTEQIFDHTPSVTLTLKDPTEYWVVVNDGVEINETEHLFTYLSTSPVIVTPLNHVVPAGASVTFTANLPEGDTSTIYEWHQGDTYSISSPVIATGKTLTLSNVQHDDVFWCSVKHDQKTYNSPFVTLTVTCTEGIGGTVSATPHFVRRNERPRLAALAWGKELQYDWYRRLPGETENTPVAQGPVIRPAINDYITYFGANLTDSCGQTGTLQEATIYLCVPTIEVPPQDQLKPPGTPVTLSVEAVPAITGQAITVTWHHVSDAWATFPLATGESFTTTLPEGKTSDSFYAALTTDCGGTPNKIKSPPATIEYCANPVIHGYTQTDYITTPGGWAKLSVFATGSSPTGADLTYQWYLGETGNTSTPLTNKTQSFLDIAPNTTTSYWCRVKSRDVCISDTGTAVVKVCRTPTIVTGPQGDRIFPNHTKELSVLADKGENTDPLKYQWQRETAPDQWTDISGAINATYTTPVLTADTNYRVKVSAGICEIISETATISMCVLPESVSGSEYKIEKNGSVTLSLPVMSPVVGKNVVWYRGEPGDISNPVRSGINVSYTTPALTATTKYWAEFEYEGCVSRTTAYTVTVCKPTITTPAANATIQSGSTTPLTVVTTNMPGETIQWYRGALGDTTNRLDGETSATFTTPVLTTTTTYWVRVSSCGFNADAAATVTVCSPPTPTLVTPSPRYIKSGQTTSLQTYAPGSNITYQWYVGSSGVTTNPIAGQTTDWLQVSPTTNTSYWCKITSYGTCVTNGPTITVDVCQDPTINVQPLSPRIFSGTATTLTVNASSTRPPTYQWYRGNAGDTSAPIGTATSSPSVTVSPTTETKYWVRVLNGVCSKDSETATISMCTFNPSYSGSEVKIGYNETATLSLPTMSPVVSKNVTWYRGAAGDISNPVRSGINVSYTTPALTATTQYWAEFEYEGCISRTTAYTVTVCKPAITAQPTNKTIASGGTAELTIGTTNIPGQTITWYSGAVGNTTTQVGIGATINVTLSATTSYWARVSSCSLNADSVGVTVTVCTAPTPTIVTPSPRYIKSGQTTSLQTYAPGSNITYQWYVGSSGVTTNPIAGQTTDWLQVSPATNTNYWCKVTSYGTCVANGPTITVDVCQDPTISVQPLSQRAFSGTATTLSVTASASRPLTYQWYRGDAGDTSAPIGTATSSPSVTVSPTTETKYWVRVLNGVCSKDSATATVSMCTFNPTYSGSEIKIAYNTSTTLSLPTLSPVVSKNVWWYRGAVGDKTNLVASGVNASFTTPALTTTTTYWAEFEYEGCYSRTTAYTVNVCKPTITTNPVNKSIASGQSETLTIATTPIAGQTIQWYIGAVGTTTSPVPGGTGTSLPVSPTTTTTYWARVSSCGHNADSTAATVSVCTAPSTTIVTPSPRYIKSGNSTSLQTYSPSPNVTYQWYVGTSGTTTTPINGQTTDWYQASPTTTTSYWCKVTSNGTCVTNGPTITVNVCNLPTISAQPVSQRIFSGSSATLSVTASSPTHTLSYQWYRGSAGDTTNPISGATSSSVPVSPTVDTNYWVTITTNGGACTTISNTATVSMCTYPAVVPGGNYNIASGQTQTLNLPTLSPVDNKNVTWYQGAVGVKTTPVHSGVNVSYTTPALTATTAYWAEFEHNGCYSRTEAYTVNVCKPTITAQPQSQVIFSGNPATLTVTATGAPLSYQWYRGNAGDTSQPVGTNSNSYTTPALSAGASYWVRVTGCTVADSATATIQVCTAPTVDNITKDPWTSIGGTGSITVAASGTNLSYQWYEGLSGDTTKPISGATSTTYTFTRQTSKYLWVRVTSNCNGAYVNSAATMYSVDPRITQEPQSVTVPVNTSATFSVTATGTYLSYQWYSYSQGLLAGATSNVFTTPALTAEHTYYCKVTSGTNGYDYSVYVTASVCQGPNVYSVTSSAVNATTYRFEASVDSWQMPDTKYLWYKGPIGNVAASQFLGETNNIYYAYNVTSPTTFWVRAMWLDETCYTDKGKTVP